MRIIAGEFRGRKLLPPQGDATRPITDRVKQSLFDILALTLPDARVYDCFAGTGSMGLESLSRGAASAVFFEVDRSALDRLKKNIDALNVRMRSEVVSRDLFKWFAATKPDARADVIFLDPPYRFLRERQEELRELARKMAEGHLAADGVVVFRHDVADALELRPLVPLDQRIYGSMMVELLGAQ